MINITHSVRYSKASSCALVSLVERTCTASWRHNTCSEKAPCSPHIHYTKTCRKTVWFIPTYIKKYGVYCIVFRWKKISFMISCFRCKNTRKMSNGRPSAVCYNITNTFKQKKKLSKLVLQYRVTCHEYGTAK